MGSTIESDLKAVLGTLREMTEGMRAWVKEHPQIVQWTLRIVAVLGLLVAGVGVVSSVLFGLLAPLLLTRTVFGLLGAAMRSEEHTSELQSQSNLVCRLL